ncbi:hypothetical protein D9757_011171 [Collybiopsis confluens]|uniref:Uncharacterized protein n=1 Tax=Collybiopsis confluens TaxID=2823264 RepID=A0A8H5H3M9_9AGAR|nr:hypothetical protein D9757_011171 [Collybiopsis confluens]
MHFQEFKGWTTTHAFFALMGGFALYKGNKHVTVLRYNPPGKRNRREILDNFNESPISCSYPGSGYAVIPPISDAAMAEANFDDCSFTAHANFIRRVRKHELEDRNKSDSFAKLIAVGQTAWFVVQLCARWATNLPVTELEIMTLAFAVMNVAIYLFWWNKPLGVGFPIRIQRDAPDQSVLEDPDEDPDDQSILSPRGRTKWAGIQHSCSLLFQQVIQEFKDILGIDHSFTEMGLCKKLLWVLITNPLRLLVAPANAILQAVLADGLTVTEGPPEKVASFERTADLEPKNGADKLIAYGAATIFGAIHCIAWTSQFPSEQEKILWRVCSLLVACIPIYMAFCNVVEALESVDDTSWWFSSLAILYVVAILLYIFARLSLLVQGFLALRALPPAALEAVQWTNFLPHI